MSKGIPFLAASVGSAKANRACGSMKRLTSHADAMRSMCGRGRVTHVLPEGGSAWWGCLVAARGRALQLDRPHSLELPPDTDPVPRRCRRQAHQECEPTHSCYTR